VLQVSQDGNHVKAKNISKSYVAIRISWDYLDPWADSMDPEIFILNNSVPPNGSLVSKEINNHISVQVWAWGEPNPGETGGECLDNFWLDIKAP